MNKKYEEILTSRLKEEEFQFDNSTKVGDIELKNALEIAQEVLDQEARIEGYPNVKLEIDPEGFVIDPDGAYFVKEIIVQFPKKKVYYLSIDKDQFSHVIKGKNNTIFYRKRFRCKK